MASGSDVKVTVTIEPEDARKLAEEVFELRERLKEAEDRAASWEALDAEAQIGADEVSRQLRDLKAELADVRAQWASDVGSAIARAQTAEARARAMELERDAARAEAARYAEALANSDPWTNDVPFNCVYCDAVWGSDIGSSENQHNAGCVWIAAAERVLLDAAGR